MFFEMVGTMMLVFTAVITTMFIFFILGWLIFTAIGVYQDTPDWSSFYIEYVKEIKKPFARGKRYG